MNREQMREELRQLRADALAATAQAEAFFAYAKELKAEADQIAARLEGSERPEVASNKRAKPRSKRRAKKKPEQQHDRPFLIYSRSA